MWNTSSSFFSSGDFVSEVWVLWNTLGGVPIRVSVSDTRWHTRLMCWAESTRALFSREWSAFIVSLFFGKSSALARPFSWENWGDHLPPAARVQPLLRQWRDWVCGDRRWSLRNEFKRGSFHLALNSGWREYTAGGRWIVCKYIFWSSRKCFSACLPRDVEHANYADIEGRRERAYAPMPPRGACEPKKKKLSL